MPAQGIGTHVPSIGGGLTTSPALTADKYIYTGYASDVDGNDFTTDATLTDRNYFAVITSIQAINNITSTLFASKWHFRSGVSVILTQNAITVPTDANGTNPVFTNAICDIKVFINGVDDTNNWTFAKGVESNVTGSITTNRLTLSGISTDSGNVIITCSKTNFSDISLIIYANKQKKGELENSSIDSNVLEITGGELTFVEDYYTETEVDNLLDNKIINANGQSSSTNITVDGTPIIYNINGNVPFILNSYRLSGSQTNITININLQTGITSEYYGRLMFINLKIYNDNGFDVDMTYTISINDDTGEISNSSGTLTFGNDISFKYLYYMYYDDNMVGLRSEEITLV